MLSILLLLSTGSGYVDELGTRANTVSFKYRQIRQANSRLKNKEKKWEREIKAEWSNWIVWAFCKSLIEVKPYKRVK